MRGLFKNSLVNLNSGEALQQHLIIIDEIDSLLALRKSDASSGVVDRATCSFLTALDNPDIRTNTFVIGTTNRPELIDPAVIRPGRLGAHL